MAAPRSVPRILQRSAPPHSPPSPASDTHVPGEGRQKGDLCSQIEAPQPSREREAGDLETTERETHGLA